MIRLMGRWSSDIYEIYCRMSIQAALRVGMAVCSAEVTSATRGFSEERFELLPQEVGAIRQAVGFDEVDDDALDAAALA